VPEVREFGVGTEPPGVLAVGIGGAGCNTLRVLPATPGLDVLAVNDHPHPSMLGVRRKLLLDKSGLREIAGMDEHAVKALATTAEQAVAVELGDAEFIVPLAGLGGEMGSWGASLVARVAALKGATSMAVVTTPFSVEGPARRLVASSALKLLRTHAHGTLVLPNDPLLRVAPNLPVLRAFEAMSKLGLQPILDLLRVLTRDDLAALKTVLRGADDWQLGIGEGMGDHPELAAVDAAFRSPWVARPPEDAREAIVLIAQPEGDERAVREILHDVDLRAPRASVMSGAFSGPDVTATRVTALLGF